MFALPFAFKAIPECLTATVVAVAVMLEQAAAFFRQRDRVLPRARDPDGFD